MLKLYFAPETISLASLIVLEEVGAEYEPIRVNFGKEEQRQDKYKAINQKARVPSLVTTDGVITETPAILVYLAQVYPQANLISADDPYEFAQLQSITSYLCSTLHVAHAHRMRAYRWTDDKAAQAAMREYVPKSMAEIWRYVETYLLKDDSWVMGSSYTVVDPYLFTVARWMEDDGVNPENYPRVLAHRMKMASRDAVVKALSVAVS